jgi:hypothetical protein
LNAGYLDSLGQREQVFAHLDPGQFLVDDPVMPHRTGHLAYAAADTLHLVTFDKSGSSGNREILLAPALACLTPILLWHKFPPILLIKTKTGYCSNFIIFECFVVHRLIIISSETNLQAGIS